MRGRPVCWRRVSDEPDPQATVTDPGSIETVDVLSARAREVRVAGQAAAPDGPALLEALRGRDAAAGGVGIKIGRYQTLEVVGSGGMGMVFGAWDPELERRVALKLLKWTSDASRERMLREGQILARLSHPNIVPVFDVGAMGDQVYLVMEFVRGTTLRAYAATKPGARGVLEAYRQAGAGLAAAHQAGVVHRDFKPDNAIRGDDGRVRVLDFGIAHTQGPSEASTARADGQRAAGTPRYMAPEQARAEVVTAAADQFAFCVSLREALTESGPVPAWLVAIVERGTAATPAERFGSFDELLVALSRDPARRWKRLALGGGVVAAAVAAFAIGKAGADGGGVEPCVGGAAEISSAWNLGLRARLTQHLHALGARADAEGQRLAGELDGYATAWAAEHRGACLAHERKELTLARYDARLGCLARTRAQLAAAGDLLSSVTTADLDSALLAARMLPDVRACASVDAAVVPPPALVAGRVAALVPQIERALVLATAERPEASVLSRAAVADARTIGYTPLLARALLVDGRAAMAIDRPDARDVLAEAMTLALKESDDVLAVEAYARLLFERARNGTTSVENWPVMETLAGRLGPGGRFARALMYNNHGVSRLVANDRSGALRMYERAKSEAGDAQEIELFSISQSLANLATLPEESEREAWRAYERYRTALGPSHQATLNARTLAAVLIRDRARARRELAGCRGLEGSALADCAYEGGWLVDEDRDLDAAARLMAQVRADDSPKARIARAYVTLRAGAAPSLPASTLADLEQIALTPITAVYQRVDAGDALVIEALAAPSAAAAEHAWQRALAVLEPADWAFYRRRVARVRAALAQLRAASAPAEAAALAELALRWYRESPSDLDLVARLERIRTGGGASGSR